MVIGQTYQIFIQAIGNENILREIVDYPAYLNKDAKVFGGVDTKAYCIMLSHSVL